MQQLRCWVRIYVSVVAALFIIDRLTKQAALTLLGDGTICHWGPFVSFELMFNRGVSWSLFHSAQQAPFVMLTMVVMVMLGALAAYTYQRARAGYSVFPELLVFAGGVSNIVDRMVYAGVIDFIGLHWRHWSFPVFNIADSLIVLGVLLMLIQGVGNEHS